MIGTLTLGRCWGCRMGYFAAELVDVPIAPLGVMRPLCRTCIAFRLGALTQAAAVWSAGDIVAQSIGTAWPEGTVR